MSYFTHESSPYPLADYETIVPSDLLVDMALTVPPSIADDCKVTAMRVTSTFAFIAVETSTEAVAHAYVQNPVPGRIYSLEAQSGSGWVMFGPGVRNAYELPEGTTVDIDRRSLIIDEADAPGFVLEVNGRQYELPDTLTIVADGYLRTTIELDRDTVSGTIPALVIRRNDAVIDPSLLTEGMLSNPLRPIYRLGPAVPDGVGNIDITVVDLSPIFGQTGVIDIPRDNDDVVGVMLWTRFIAGCPYEDIFEKLKFSDCGEGSPYELPFDKVVGDLKGETCPDDPPTCS